MRPFSLLRSSAPASKSALQQRKQLRQLLCESLEERALMAVFSVSNLNDSGDGSLREAIRLANLTPNSAGNTNTLSSQTGGTIEDVIQFNLPAGPQTITLGSELEITDGLRIDGLGSSQLKISGNDVTRIFNIRALGTFEFNVFINDVTLTHGKADNGGAIRNEFASVYLNNVAVTSSVATANGGGIYNDRGHIELSNTVLDSNAATLDGGAVFTQSDRVIIGAVSESLFVYNNSSINNNSARRGGGIYAVDDHVDVFLSTVSNNSATQDGGGIYSTATFANALPRTLNTNQAIISGNRAVGVGGGVFVDSDTMFIGSSTIEANKANQGGGIYLSNRNGNFIFAEVSYSTINNNEATFGAGGGMYFESTPSTAGNLDLRIANSTFSTNLAATQGGGLYFGPINANDFVQVTQSTVANNRAVEGGGLFAADNKVFVQSSLIAQNTAATGPDSRGTFTTIFNRFESFSAFNLVGNGAGSNWRTDLNLVGTTATINPLIGPLQDNGGFTKTHALLIGSPALDVGNSFGDDQRGAVRGNGDGGGDIGAYERAFDFGDAPAPFPTTLQSNGARHLFTALRLGPTIDTEVDGQPSDATFANLDGSDEDGVVFNFSSTAGFTGSAQVTSSGAGLINAWIDVSGNGAWEPGEQILTNVAVVAGVNLLTFTLPAPPAGAAASFSAIARFRLSTTPNLQPTGPAEDGEVEDYAMNINRVILPDGTLGDGYTFSERVPPRVRRSYDPELAYGYNYETLPARTVGSVVIPAGDNFTEVELLAGFGDNVFTIHLYNTTTGKYESAPLATVTAPAIINFETGTIEDAAGVRENAFTPIAGGVDKFRVLGIELSAGLLPTDTAAFPTFLSFGDADNNGEAIVNFKMTPLATPVAVPESFTMREDEVLLGTSLLNNDTDRNSDALTAFVFSQPSNGSVVINSNGTFTYTPNANFNGSDVFKYRAFDGLQYSDPVAVTVAVTSVNDAPLGGNSIVELLEDSVATLSLSDVVFSDPSDSPANSLQSLTITTLPAVGSLKLSGADVTVGQVITAANIGNLTFAPAANAYGNPYATFSFKVKDNGGTTDNGVDTAVSDSTISFKVLPVNDAPSIVLGGNQSVREDAGATTVVGWASNISAGPANESSQVLTINVTSDNQQLFSAQPAVAADGTLTFTPAPNAFGTAIVSVQVKDDGGTSNGGVDSSTVQTFVIEVTPVNDAPTFSLGLIQSALEDAGPQSIAGAITAITAGAANESGQVLTFTVTNNNNALFTTQPAIAANGTLTYTAAPNANGTAVVTVQLKDDGGVANGGIDTSAVQTFTLTIVPVNDAPNFTPGPDQTVLEDSGARTVTGWATGITAGPANESAQVLTFSTTNNNNALFSVQPSVASDGTLTYTPAANANGSAVVTVRLADNGGTTFLGVDNVVKTLTISVTPVNDAPSFTKGVNLTVAANAGAQTVTGWATAIAAGPANESTQTVSFTVTNSNNALFSVQPTIAPNGTLTFTPATTGNGTATVTVVLKDNGGVASGGVDTSVAQTFTITVNPVTTNNRPTASITGPASVVRGQSVAFTVSATDPDAGDNAAGFLFAINWGDGSPVQTLPAGTPSGTVVNHTFAANGRFTVSLTARDRTGLVSAAVTRVVTAGAVLQQGSVLVIGGGTTNDSINVFNALGLRAVVNGTWFGPYSGITSIQIFGQAGNDCINIDSAITIPALIDGGEGDDKIDGGSGDDTLLGGNGRDCIDGAKGNDFIDGGADNDTVGGGDGNDIVLGGSGNDLLYGGNGRDLLIGGLGADYLYGGNDDDILIGGTTSYDNNRAALDAVMLEWTRTNVAYATRLSRLRDGSAGGLNGTYRLNTTTVQNDAQVDQLFGEAGTDWFFASNNVTTGDRLRDRASTETATSL